MAGLIGQLTGTADGVGGVLTMRVSLTVLVTALRQLKHRCPMILGTTMATTAHIDVVVMVSEILLLDAFITALITSYKGGHLYMHWIQLLNARVDVHVP